jgi:hypothetical protein
MTNVTMCSMTFTPNYSPGGYLLMFIDWRNKPALQEIIHAAGIQLRGVMMSFS